MSEHVEAKEIRQPKPERVWDVREFARRFRLDKDEEARLLKLFGPSASECELMMNATRKPRWRM